MAGPERVISNWWPLALWKPVSMSITSFVEGSAVVTGGKIYLLGGGKQDATVEEFRPLVVDPASGTVQFIPRMNTPRYAFMAGKVGDQIIVAGGIAVGHPSFSQRLATVEVYHINSGFWSSGPPLPYPLSWAACGVINDKLVVAGGFSDKRENRVLILDAPKGCWYQAAQMPNAISHAASVVLNDKLYIFGGISNPFVQLQSCYIYDFRSNYWIVGPQLPESRASAAAVAIYNEILITGGTSNISGIAHDEVYVYNPVTNLYGSSFPMFCSRSDHVVCEVNNKVYAIGGNNKYPIEVGDQNFMTVSITPGSREVSLQCELWLVQGQMLERKIAGTNETVTFPSFRCLTLAPVYVPTGASILVHNGGQTNLLIRDFSQSCTLDPNGEMKWMLKTKANIGLSPVR